MDEHIRVETNGMIYDSKDPRCALIYQWALHGEIAFIKCMAGDYPKFYWGLFSSQDPEGSIRRIMEWGGKWAKIAAPLNKIVEQGAYPTGDAFINASGELECDEGVLEEGDAVEVYLQGVWERTTIANINGKWSAPNGFPLDGKPVRLITERN